MPRIPQPDAGHLWAGERAMAEARLAASDLAVFGFDVTGGHWRPAAHHIALCRALERVEAGEIKRLIVCMPPRHGKSEIASRIFPAWFLGRNPNREVILAAHTAELAMDLSRAARQNVVELGMPLWGIRLSQESKAVQRWGFRRPLRGGLVAAGVGGPITGRGAHLAIIDDPIKNMAEARSQTYREHLWEWYRSTLRTRLAPNGAIVICMTRWHADDLPGRLLAAMEVGGEKWEVMNFPARAGVGDALGRSPGQPLWPEWFPEAELSGIEQAVGPYVWAALYEQKPIRDNAGALWRENLIEPFRAPAPPELDRIIVVVDPAGSENPESSETGICVAGAVGEGVNRRGYLLEDLSGHYSPLEWGTLAVDAYKRHKADGIYGETNYGGDMVEATIRGIDPLVPFARVDATRGKKLRADPVVALYQQGRIHHIRPFPELEIQMCNWDGGGKSPDRLDVVVHAFTKLMLEEADGRKDRSVRTMAEMLGRR